MRRSICATLQAYRDFREEAHEIGFRHFLEVFVPTRRTTSRRRAAIRQRQHRPAAGRHRLAHAAAVSEDAVFRPGRAGAARQLRQLARRRHPGRLAGTTFDAFNMLWEAKKYGARAALFGRKINNAEHQLSFVTHLRALADGNAEPADAVRAYHADLEKLHHQAASTTLADDSRPAASYAMMLFRKSAGH